MSEWAVSRQKAKGGQVKKLERITCKKRRKEKEEKEKDDENKDKKKEQAKEQIESTTQLQAVLLIH